MSAIGNYAKIKSEMIKTKALSEIMALLDEVCFDNVFKIKKDAIVAKKLLDEKVPIVDELLSQIIDKCNLIEEKR